MPVLNTSNKTRGSFYQYHSHKLISRSDKSVQAEMKNKREISRLQLHCKVLDKQGSHCRYLIEKDKYMARRFMTHMRQTSGVSIEGEAPRGHWDRKHEKSPYFQGALKVSEKRFKHWKVAEAKLQRELQPVMLDKDKVKEDTPYQTRQKMEIVLGMMGYEETEVDKLLYKAEQLKETPKTNKQLIRTMNRKAKTLGDMKLTPYKTVPDVFACLRSDEEIAASNEVKEESRPNEWFKPESLVPTIMPFSINKWEKDIVKQYAMDMAHSPEVTTKERIREIRSADHQKLIKNRKYNNVDGSENKVAQPNRSKIRPHSSGTGRTASKRDKSVIRPKTAIGISKTNETAMKKPVEKVLHQNYVSEKDRDEISEVGNVNSISDDQMPPSLPYATKTNQINTKQVSFSDNDKLQNTFSENAKMPISRQRSCSTQIEKSSPDQAFGTEKDRRFSYDEKLVSHQLSHKTKEHIQTNKEKTKPSITLNDSKDRIPNSRRTEKTKARRPSSSSSISSESSTKQSLKPVSQTLHPRRSSSSSTHGIKSLHQVTHTSLSQRPSSSNSVSSCTSAQSTKTGTTTQSYKNKYGDSDLDSSSGEDDDDAASGYRGQQQLPRWKRDLMREAPPSVFTSKAAPRVNLTMSKTQRARELEKLKDENENSMKKICDTEHERRIQSRVNIFVTMLKVRQAVETLKSKAASREEDTDKTET